MCESPRSYIALPKSLTLYKTNFYSHYASSGQSKLSSNGVALSICQCHVLYHTLNSHCLSKTDASSLGNPDKARRRQRLGIVLIVREPQCACVILPRPSLSLSRRACSVPLAPGGSIYTTLGTVTAWCYIVASTQVSGVRLKRQSAVRLRNASPRPQ